MRKKIKKKEPSITQEKKANIKPSLTDIFINRNSLWITLVIILVLIFVVFNNFIFGSKYYLFTDIGSDTINLFYTNFVMISKYLRTEGFPLWSFAQGLGQEIMSISFTNPFNLIVYLVNTENIAYYIIWIELSKIIITVFIFYYFLKQLNFSGLACIIGTILYNFSGFMIVGGEWYIFSTEACYLALLLLGFEKLYFQNSWYLFPLAVALLAILLPFNLYFYGLFLIIYFLLRHFTNEGRTWKKFFRISIIMAGLSLLGIMISSFFSYSELQLMLDSPRVSGNSSYFSKLFSHSVFFIENKVHYTTAILRFFSNDLLGNGNDFKGWNNYLEAPLFYIGLLPLLLLPQIFLITENRKKIAYSIFMFIILLPIIFPFFRYALWNFTGDYFRGFSIFVAIGILLLSLEVLDKTEKGKNLNPFLIIGTLIVLLILLYFPYKNEDDIVNHNLQPVIRNFLIIYSLILICFRFEMYKPMLRIILLLAVFTEIAYLNYETINQRMMLTSDDMKEKKAYNDYTVDAVKYINNKDKSFYRIEKEYLSNYTKHLSLNEAKVQGYYGTKSYTSFNQKYYVHFLEEMNVITKGKETESRWIMGINNFPLLFNITSNKYFLTKQAKSYYRKIGYDSLTMIGDVRILRNRYCLPLGFTYEEYVPVSRFKGLKEIPKNITIQKAFVAEEPINEDLKKLKQYDTNDPSLANYSSNDNIKDMSLRKKDTLNITHFSQNKITGDIDLKTTKLLFFSIPYDRGWNANIDGRKVKPLLCNFGFMGFVLEPGKHNVELFYKPPYFNLTLILSLVGLLIYILMIIGDKLNLLNKKVKNIT